MRYIIRRFLEPSSWAGIGLVASTVDTIINNGGLSMMTQTEMGAILTGLVAIFMPGKVIADAPPNVYPVQKSNSLDRE
jgi:hypothetical protein